MAKLKKIDFIKIDNRTDLHGLTQEDAFASLEIFIPVSFEKGCKNILVITGESGVLKENVPRWLQYNEIFAKFISEIKQAPAHLGGQGAFIVRFKKIK